MEEKKSRNEPFKLEEIIDILKEKYDPEIEGKLIALYLSGSRLYGTASPESDWDYIAVTYVPTKNLFVKEEDTFVADLPFPVSSIDIYEEDELNVTFFEFDHYNLMVKGALLGLINSLFKVLRPFFKVKGASHLYH